MKVSPERAAQIDAALDRLLDLPAVERRDHIAAVCGDDLQLREEVERLLGFSEIADEGFAQRVGLGQQNSASSTVEYEIGQAIGPYRLLEEIGRGGMGVVYLAQRIDGGFSQQVALKLSLRVAEAESENRFTQERQILANLQHPNIARLLDGGFADTGQPYFALEFVEGRPIDVYCDAEQLSIEERLHLFEQVIEGVQSAHSNLVVHRDIKPNNILVTTDGQVKLIDFGIAKLLGAAELEEMQLTRTVARVMTPEYASPEQATGQPISLASDLYQLGLLLYRLLSGRAPYSFHDTSPSAVEKVICQMPPTRPSVAVAHLAADSEHRERIVELAAKRRTTPERLARFLRGDLDTIILKALRKEPERRYMSASDLLEDVRRYRGGLPIRARKDTWRYRIGKFITRYRWGVAAAAAFLALLVGYGVTVTLQARSISLERDRANTAARQAKEVTGFLLSLFERSSPAVSRDRDITAQELVDQGARRLLNGLEEQPQVRAQLLTTLARVYSWLGDYDQSLDLAEQAERLSREAPGDLRAELANALAIEGTALIRLDRSVLARSTLENGLALAQELYGETSVEAADLRRLLATSDLIRGDIEGAEEGFHGVLALLDELDDPPAAVHGEAMSGLGVIHQMRGDFESAEAAYTQASGLYSEAYGEDHPLVLDTSRKLAIILGTTGQRQAAIEILRSNIALAERIFGPVHPEVANQLTALGLALAEAGRPDEAIDPLKRALDQRAVVLGSDHPEVTMARTNLGYAWYRAEQLDKASEMFRLAIETGRPRSGAVALSRFYLGKVLLRTDRAAEAVESFRYAWSVYEPFFGPDNGKVSEMAVDLALGLAALDRTAEAKQFLREQIARIETPSEFSERMSDALRGID